MRECEESKRKSYRSDLTPNPGPLGGSVRDVSPPAGSQENRPLLKGKQEIQDDVLCASISNYCFLFNKYTKLCEHKNASSHQHKILYRLHTCTNKYRHWVRTGNLLGLGRGRNVVFLLIKVPALEANPVEISSQSSGGILFLFRAFSCKNGHGSKSC